MPGGPCAPVGPSGPAGPCAPVNPRGPWLPRSCARTEGLTWPMLVMTKWLAAPAPAASTDRAITAARIVVRFIVDSSDPALAIGWAAPDSVGRGPPVKPLAESGVD